MSLRVTGKRNRSLSFRHFHVLVNYGLVEKDFGFYVREQPVDQQVAKQAPQILFLRSTRNVTVQHVLNLALSGDHGVFVEEVLLAGMPTSSVQGCIHSVFRNKYPMITTIHGQG
jgi:hypothetical protein